MALLTDGNLNDTEALRMYETSILDVANVERIDLQIKLGLAQEEVSESVLNILLDHAWTPDPQSWTRRRRGVTDVVVSPQLKRWHAFHTLATVYRDAFNNQLNDRYKVKWNEYAQLARNAHEETLKFGIGLALTPVPKAPQPVFSIASGTNPATIYYVEVTWVAAMGQEGAPSDLTAYETADTTTLVVGMTNPPSVATGFNVYVGLTAATVALQNSTPISTDQTFTLPMDGLAPGNPPGSGQLADTFIIGGRLLRRG